MEDWTIVWSVGGSIEPRNRPGREQRITEELHDRPNSNRKGAWKKRCISFIVALHRKRRSSKAGYKTGWYLTPNVTDICASNSGPTMHFFLKFCLAENNVSPHKFTMFSSPHQKYHLHPYTLIQCIMSVLSTFNKSPSRIIERRSVEGKAMHIDID